MLLFKTSKAALVEVVVAVAAAVNVVAAVVNVVVVFVVAAEINRGTLQRKKTRKR